MTTEPSITESCNCRICEQSREFYKHMDILKAARLGAFAEFFEDIYSELAHVQMDNAVNKAIIDGSWPDADQIIETARAKRNG